MCVPQYTRWVDVSRRNSEVDQSAVQVRNKETRQALRKKNKLLRDDDKRGMYCITSRSTRAENSITVYAIEPVTKIVPCYFLTIGVPWLCVSCCSLYALCREVALFERKPNSETVFSDLRYKNVNRPCLHTRNARPRELTKVYFPPVFSRQTFERSPSDICGHTPLTGL